LGSTWEAQEIVMAELTGRVVEGAMRTTPAAQAGARIGIEAVVRTLIQFIALTYEDKAEDVVRILREGALDGLNATKIDNLSDAQREEIFQSARTTVQLILDVSLSKPVLREGTH
jgi:hypothetical protein